MTFRTNLNRLASINVVVLAACASNEDVTTLETQSQACLASAETFRIDIAACADGGLAGCAELVHTFGCLDEAEVEEVVGDLEGLCGAVPVLVCELVAVDMIERAAGRTTGTHWAVPASREIGQRILTSGCMADDPLMCNRLVSLANDGLLPSISETGIVRLRRLACEMGDLRVCNDLIDGARQAPGGGVQGFASDALSASGLTDPHLVSAAALCDLSPRHGCLLMGSELFGDEAYLDVYSNRALLRAFARLCSLGSAYSCGFADYLCSIESLSPDSACTEDYAALAREIHNRECLGAGSPELIGRACLAAGLFYLGFGGVVPDVRSARDYLDRGCGVSLLSRTEACQLAEAWPQQDAEAWRLVEFADGRLPFAWRRGQLDASGESSPDQANTAPPVLPPSRTE